MRNTQADLGAEAQTKHLNNFMMKMKNSGHSEQFRKQILDSSYNAYQEMVKADQSGEKPFYRDKNWQKDLRKNEKNKKRLNWYKSYGKNQKVQYTTVLFVPSAKVNMKLIDTMT